MDFRLFGLFQLGLNMISLSLCVELRLPVLPSVVIGLALSSWLLAPRSPPSTPTPTHPSRSLCPAHQCLPPHALPHPLQDVDFSLDARFALFGCTGDFKEFFFF